MEGNILPAFCASVIARALVAPLDTMRIRRAVFGRGAGFGNLYAGLPVSLAFSVPGTVSFLVTYTYVSKDWGHVMGATAAEMIAGLFFVPMEVLKQRQQLGLAGYTQGLGIALRSTSRREYFRGYGVSLAAFVPYSSLYFSLYGRLGTIAGNSDGRVGDARRFACSLLSAAVAGALTTPLDAVRIRYQTSAHAGFKDVVLNVWRNEGPRFLFRGTLSRVVWACANTGCTVAIYDMLRQRYASK